MLTQAVKGYAPNNPSEIYKYSVATQLHIYIFLTVNQQRHKADVISKREGNTMDEQKVIKLLNLEEYEWEWIIRGLDLLIERKEAAITINKEKYPDAAQLMQEDIVDIERIKDKIRTA